MDEQNEKISPEHYQNCSIECIDAMEIAYGTDNVIMFCFMNAFKYLWRYKYKNGVDDLKKAFTYMKMADSRNTAYDLELEKISMDMYAVLSRYMSKEGIGNYNPREV